MKFFRFFIFLLPITLFAQSNCGFEFFETPEGQPLQMFEFEYFEQAARLEAKSKLMKTAIYHFSPTGKVDSVTGMRQILGWEKDKHYPEMNHYQQYILTHQNYIYDEQGMIQRVEEKDKDGKITMTQYFQPKSEGIVEMIYEDFIKEFKFKRLYFFKNCKKTKVQYLNDDSTVAYENILDGEKILKSFSIFGEEKTELLRDEQLEQFDEKGNWTVKSFKIEDGRSGRKRILRFFIYPDSPTTDDQSIEAMADVFLEGFRSGSFDPVIEQYFMHMSQSMQLYAKSEDYGEPNSWSRVFSVMDKEKYLYQFRKQLLNFRSRKFINWEKTKIQEIKFNPPKPLSYNKDILSTRVTIVFSDGENQTNYSFHAAQFHSGWYYLILK